MIITLHIIVYSYAANIALAFGERHFKNVNFIKCVLFTLTMTLPSGVHAGHPGVKVGTVDLFASRLKESRN